MPADKAVSRTMLRMRHRNIIWDEAGNMPGSGAREGGRPSFRKAYPLLKVRGVPKTHLFDPGAALEHAGGGAQPASDLLDHPVAAVHQPNRTRNNLRRCKRDGAAGGRERGGRGR